MKDRMKPLMFVGDDEPYLPDVLEAHDVEGEPVRGGGLYPTWAVLLAAAEVFDRFHDEGKKGVRWPAVWRIAEKDPAWRTSCDVLFNLDRSQEDDDRFLRHWVSTWLYRACTVRVYPEHMTTGAVLKRIAT